MNDAKGIVTSLEGSVAVVTVEGAGSGCGRCDQPGGCGRSAGLDGAEKGRCRVVRIQNAIGARVGDRVHVSVAPGAVLRAAVRVYLIPLGLAFTGAALATVLQPGDEGAVLISSLAGLALGVLALRWPFANPGQGREPMFQMNIKD